MFFILNKLSLKVFHAKKIFENRREVVVVEALEWDQTKLLDTIENKYASRSDVCVVLCVWCQVVIGFRSLHR